jgi:tRNA (Thr-GGU) A37 N-methylase
MPELQLRPIGVISSDLDDPATAPKQGLEGAPDAWLELHPWAAEGLRGLVVGQELIVITWLDRARRDVLMVHPRDRSRRSTERQSSISSPC